jgi:hypothetical protein
LRHATTFTARHSQPIEQIRDPVVMRAANLSQYLFVHIRHNGPGESAPKICDTVVLREDPSPFAAF